ncbi:MAG: flagellar M-ring protein FliF [Sedimentisphaerales bacterium]|nr:flagellar M-ring protein FliF [Sedimentisphaerales bacterium]
MDFFQKIRAIWENVSLVQRALLVAVVLTLGTVTVLLIQWARKPDMRMLYQQLLPEEASKITEKISEKSIAYELRNGGTTIYAPKEHIYQLRLDMAKEGLPAGQQGGYSIFDKEKVGASPFAQEVNYKRALQEELAKSIQMVDGVDYARVHIVNTEKSIFASKAAETTASVVLRLRPGYTLSALNIAAITNLVAGSVDGLASDSVTLIDSQGRLLSGESGQAGAQRAGTVQAYKERVEQSLEKKVEDMLTTVLGPGRAAVKVSAVIDMNSVSTVKEIYESKGIVSKEEIQKNEEKDPVAASGGNAAAAAGSKKDETITTEYVNPRTVEQKEILPGRVVSLSVSAIVDLSVSDANEAGSGAANAKIMQVADVEKLIRNALGLDPLDTDSLTVVDAKFPRQQEALIDVEPSSWPRYMAIVRHASLGIMAICALLVLRIFRGAKKKAGKKGATEELPAADTAGTAGLLPAGTIGTDSLALRRQITGALRQNPEHVKQVFAGWIEERQA